MPPFQDLTGKKFGFLKVKERTYIEGYKRSAFICECKCGKFVTVKGKNLQNGHVTSCGFCTQSEISKAKNLISNIKQEHGTNISRISSTTIQKNNKSGCPGVYYVKKSGKWRARISFQGKRYSLGNYYKKEDAESAYNNAKEKLHYKFLEWYQKNYPNTMKNKEVKKISDTPNKYLKTK